MRKKGFTLIELIVVMAIISILVLFGMPKYKSYTEEARITKLTVEVKELEKASQKYYIKNNDWPRLSDEPYSNEQVLAFGKRILDKTGKVVELEIDGNYYDIDYAKLGNYISKPSNPDNYILQNPVGSIYSIDKPTEVAKLRFDSIPPEEVKNIIFNIENEYITLTWDTVSDSDLDKYNIYRDGVLIGSSDLESYSDISADKNIDYLYKVTSVDIAGNESNGIEITYISPFVEPNYTPENKSEIILISGGTTTTDIDSFLDGDDIRLVWENKTGIFNPETKAIENVSSFTTGKYFDVAKELDGTTWTSFYRREGYFDRDYLYGFNNKTGLNYSKEISRSINTEYYQNAHGIVVNPINKEVVVTFVDISGKGLKVEKFKPSGGTYISLGSNDMFRNGDSNSSLTAGRPLYDKEGNLYIIYAFKRGTGYSVNLNLYKYGIDGATKTINLGGNFTVGQGTEVEIVEDTAGRIWVIIENLYRNNFEYAIINKDMTIYKGLSKVFNTDINNRYQPTLTCAKDGTIWLFYLESGQFKSIKFTN